MALTGAEGAPPLLIDRDVAGRVDALRAWVMRLAVQYGRPIEVPQAWVVGRAALMGLMRGGTMSCNRSARMMRARDGWFVLNLARADDRDLLPALFDGMPVDDDWPAIAEAVATRDVATLAAQAKLLGLPAGTVGEGDGGAPIKTWSTGERLRSWRRERPPLVVDLSALWAGPLCGRILADMGADVIKVESRGRPDASREGCPAFFEMLNAPKDVLLLDFQDEGDLRELGALLRRADVVIEASRPRALDRLGLSREAITADNRGLVWVSITGHGRDGDDAMRVGFGDDAAAVAGLVAWQGDVPHFIGDALADPAAGLMAAGAIVSAWLGGEGQLIDTSLRGSAAWVSAAAPIADELPARVVGDGTGGFALVQGDSLFPVMTPGQIVETGQ